MKIKEEVSEISFETQTAEEEKFVFESKECEKYRKRWWGPDESGGYNLNLDDFNDIRSLLIERQNEIEKAKEKAPIKEPLMIKTAEELEAIDFVPKKTQIQVTFSEGKNKHCGPYSPTGVFGKTLTLSIPKVVKKSYDYTGGCPRCYGIASITIVNGEEQYLLSEKMMKSLFYIGKYMLLNAKSEPPEDLMQCFSEGFESLGNKFGIII